MTKQLVLLLGFFLSCTAVQGQILQLGLGGSVNGTIFHKGQSVYQDYFYKTKIKYSFGLSVPFLLKLNDHWAFRTGIGFQNKKYHFEQNKYDFPNVVDGTGSFYFQFKFLATEVPLIICFSPTNKDRLNKIEYKLGCILTYNSPKITTGGIETFEYNGSDTCNYYFSGAPPNWTNYFSPDIYAGISFIKMKGSLRRHELTLSYQYSFTPTTRVELFSSVWTASMTKEYNVTLRPNLSYIALTYTYYPKWLNIIKDKGGQIIRLTN